MKKNVRFSDHGFNAMDKKPSDFLFLLIPVSILAIYMGAKILICFHSAKFPGGKLPPWAVRKHLSDRV